jgi:hypothetical protein
MDSLEAFRMEAVAERQQFRPNGAPRQEIKPIFSFLYDVMA